MTRAGPARAMLAAALLLGLGPSGPSPSAGAASAKAQAGATRQLFFQFILQARVDGRPRAALAYLDEFDQQYPGDPDALALRINCLLDLHDVGRATAIAAAAPADKDNGALTAARGHVQAASGRWTDAAQLYQAAVRASPTDAQLRNALGYAQLRSGDAPQAVETLRGAADLAPSSDVIRNNLLLALTMAGRQAEAAAAIAQIGDAQARARLPGQIAAEAARIGATPPPGPRPDDTAAAPVPAAPGASGGRN